MRKKEKELIEKAIKALHETDGWDEGMEILCKLVGRKPLVAMLDKGAGENIIQLCDRLGGKDQEFSVNIKGLNTNLPTN